MRGVIMLDNFAFEIGVKLGEKSYQRNKLFYQDIYNKLETENDALEVMANCWLAEEDQIRLIYRNCDLEDLRKGWSKGFLDALFPMRDLC